MARRQNSRDASTDSDYADPVITVAATELYDSKISGFRVASYSTPYSRPTYQCLRFESRYPGTPRSRTMQIYVICGTHGTHVHQLLTPGRDYVLC